MLPRGIVTKEKFSALSFVFLMLTMSLSASIQAWQFLEDVQTTEHSVVSSYSSATLVQGFFGTIPTNASNSQSGGTYGIDAASSGLSFAENGFNRSIDAVAIGSTHICAILQGGLYCSGKNTYGQLGLGTADDQDQFVQVDLGTGRVPVRITAGSSHTCALLDDGSVNCWGLNSYGQLGTACCSTQTTPQVVDLGTGRTAVSISAGRLHTCAVLDDGSLKCWGGNNYGQLGVGSTSAIFPSPQSVFVGTGNTISSVDAGMYHTCAVLDDGSMKCWGWNTAGQLGIGNTLSQTTAQVVDLGLGRTAVSVSAGYSHTCALLDDGSLKCWGDNSNGRLGTGGSTVSDFNTPQDVSLGFGRTALSVTAGYAYTCSVLDDGTHKCWGSNSYGQLGIGSLSQKTTPTTVLEINSTKSLIYASESSSYSLTCAFMENSLYCWGTFFSNTADRILSPHKMQITKGGSESISLGYHTCLVDGSKRLKCLGSGSSGQLGRNDTYNSGNAMSPYGLENTDVTMVAAGEYNTCAILGNGSLNCWGRNTDGQLGIGSTTQQTTPQFVDLGLGRTAIDVSMSGYHTCAVLDDGSLKCWGRNSDGQLGLGNMTSQSTPVSVNLGLGRTAVSVSVGGSASCAILDDGVLKCWGRNTRGQLGIGNTLSQTTPQAVDLGTGRTALQVGVGSQHVCAILDNLTLKCWGGNDQGQLGIGSNTQQTTPQSVDLGSGRTASSVSEGGEHTCAILDDGSLKCWGWNTNGQLGVSSYTSQNSPEIVVFDAARTVIRVNTGIYHTCAELDDGSIKCWGGNTYGQLGDGSTNRRYIPVSTSLGLISVNPLNQIDVPDESWYGIPTTLGSSTLSVHYNTSTSSTLHQVNLTVVSALQYATNQINLTIDQNISALVPVLSGGPYADITVSPPLPNGLILNPENGTITGKPTVASTAQNYTLLIQNSSGQSKVNLTISVVDEVPDISIQQSAVGLLQGFRSHPVNLSNTGGQVKTITSTPTLHGLHGTTLNTGKALLSNDEQVCFSTSSGIYCTSDGVTSRVWNLTGEAISFIGEDVCAVVEFTSSCTDASRLSSFSSQEVNNSIGIAGTDGNTCLLDINTRLRCSGDDYTGVETVGSEIEMLTSVVSSPLAICGQTFTGRVYCWGKAHGPIGQGQPATTWSPVEVDMGVNSHAVSLSLADEHGCALLNTSEAVCWGTGTSGQLGYGFTSDSSYPRTVDVANWVEFTSISAGGKHSCAMNSLGGVMCWGNNEFGQLGDGTTTNRTTPVNVTNIPSWMNVVEVHAVNEGTCVVDETGGVWCWGNNANGKLGLNSSINIATNPSPVRFPVSSALRMTHNVNAHIFGAPLVNQSATNHRWYANNSGGSDDVNISISVGVAAEYSQHVFNLTRNASSVNVQPTITGGPYQFTIVPGLPAGMSIGASNGTIWGMPTQPHALTNHTIFVENNSGYDQVKIVLQVHDIAPTIVYPSSSYSLVRNWTTETIVPSHQDGDVVFVNSSSDLPQGLNLIRRDASFGKIEAGHWHTCVLIDGNVQCWGSNGWGQLGIGNQVKQPSPQSVSFSPGVSIRDISLGDYHSCAISTNNNLYCWGSNVYGKAGLGSSISSSKTPSLVNSQNVKSVSAGGTHTCAIYGNNSLYCWGGNNHGQVGIGSTMTQVISPTYIDLGLNRHATKVATGFDFTCVLLDDASVKCWGNNNYYNLGKDGSSSTVPLSVSLPSTQPVIDIETGSHHTCVIYQNGSTTCWGRNLNGQLGLGNRTTQSGVLPSLVSSLSNSSLVAKLSLGSGHSCAILDNGKMSCWGRNSDGILGIGTITDEWSPKELSIPNGVSVEEIALGDDHTCAILSNTSIMCWGRNFDGSLGLGNTSTYSVSIPQQVPGIATLPGIAGTIFGKPTTITAASNYTLTANNTYGSSNDTVWIEVVPAYDYGNNTLVLTRNQSFSRSPVITGGPYNASFSPALPLGLSFNVSNGTIWGMPTHLTSTNTFILHVSNSTGSDSISLKIYIDDIPPTISYSEKNHTFIRNWTIQDIVPSHKNGTVEKVVVSPDLPNGLVNLPENDVDAQISLKSTNSCTLIGGVVSCWGTTSSTYQPSLSTPQTINFSTGRYAVSVDVGYNGWACSILDNGSVACWQPISPNSIIPANQVSDSGIVPSGRQAIEVASGFSHRCAILDNFSLVCAGSNHYGQLGTSASDGYVDLGVGRTTKKIGLGNHHTCAVLDDGSLKCWGENNRGQIGLNNAGTFGGTNSYSSPQTVPLPSGRTALDVSTGGLHTCVLLDNYSIMCAGYNHYGQLGFGNASNYAFLDYVNIPNGVTPSVLFSSEYRTCFISTESDLYCWGRNDYSEFGTSTSDKFTSPTLIDVGEDVIKADTGESHICVMVLNGSVKCWGRNHRGQLGLGNSTDMSTPTTLSNFDTAPPLLAGSIYGRPVTTAQRTNYTLTANNTFGSSNDTISIEVLPAYDYGNETIWLTRNQTMTPRSPIITGGPYTATIWPPVPSGLFWNASNGTFWGTPDMNQTWTEYYINVSNSTGRDTIIVKIGIGDIVPYVTYTNTTMTYIRGFVIDDEIPTHLGGHITTVETYPALPEGLSISDPSTWTSSRPNGTIHGIPTELAAATVYQIWFNNSIGSYLVNLTIDVIPSYDYGNGTISLTRNETMTARSPIITGGPYATVQLNGTLPLGLFFNAANGTVWGTPSTVVSTTQFIVYIANAWGEDEVSFNITVAEIPPILEYNLAAMSYRRGFLSEHPYPILTGGEVATYEISNSLPPGLMFNDSNGFISGVPTTVWNASVFTVWANNSLGSSSWNLTIEVLAGITHPSTNVVYVRNQTIQAYEPTINIVERNLSITPPLPPGLTFNLQNGTITGSSLIPWTPVEHSIHLWNATGEDWLNVTIIVQEILPDVRYDASLTEALNQFGIVPLLPNGTGGTPVEWSADFKGLEGLHILHNATESTLSGFGNTLCMISSDEEVLCWGANDMGQLGQGHAIATTGVQSVLLTLQGTPRDIDVGKTHVCVVLSSGQIDCWGQNDQGQLGQDFVCVYGSFSDGCNGNFAVPQSGQAVNPTSGNFTQVSVGKAHTCALHENGQVYCWGDNSDGQLGLGTSQSVSVPTLVNTMLRFTSIDTGDAHTCGIDEQGEVWCWGRNAFGQLGDSTTISRNLPAKVQLPPGYSAKSISVGAEHSCAILNESQPACWGRNSQGQLGDGTILGKIAPRIVPGSAMGQIVSIEAGPAQTCVVNASAAVWCWGASTSGAFLSNSGNALSPISVETPFGLSIHNIAVGEGQLCSISSRSSLLCRGTNQQGQLLGETVPQRSNFSEWFVETVALSHHPAGTVYGRPSNGTGTYILQLNVSNIVGTHSFNHSIQVMDALSLGLSRIEMIRNTTTSPVLPSTSTYASGTFYIEPSLPSGLMFNSTTGEISGRPNVNMTLTSYAMIFANEFGHDERMFDLIIYEPAADVVYPGLDIQMTRGEGNLDWIPVVSNGSVETWSIVPNLPDGLVFENGALTGTPSVNSTSTVYRIYANNTGGVTFVDLNITVVEPRPVLLVGSNEYTFTRQSAISAIVVANTGGFVEQWSIEPDLPEGLTFIDGVLSGTPSVNMTLTTFTVFAQNSGGTFVRNINITVLEPVPILESSSTDVVFVRGEPITNVEIINNGGMIANWTISPSLPDGMLFENGVLFGTPEVNSTLQIYTIAALNSGGQATFTLEIEVVEPLPEFNYTEEEFILSRNTPFEAIVPVSDGGYIASWTISPTLPSGLFFDERRGVIQGLAVSTSPSLVYTIVAENSGGQTIGYLSIEVRNPAPSFTLPSNELAIVEGQEMNRFTPFVASGDVVDSWELSIEGAESLPEGLVFDLTTGALSGRPAKGATILELTIVATNDGGSSSVSLNLSILADFDGDGIADINDEDDDNDGYSDIEEQSKDSNPMDSTSTPIEGFEFIIPNTEISLGAWDIIGMLTGIPLIVWLTFSLVTRNKRTQTFVDDMKNAKTREELEAVAERYEKAIMWKLIGPHHGMRLERLRAEADDAIEERDRAFKYKLEESAKEEEARKELGAEFFDEVDQTPLVEKAEKGDTSEQDEDEKSDEVEPEEGEDAENAVADDVSTPDPSEPATSVDEIGYEWLVVEEGTSFYRVAGSSDPWVKYEN